MDENKTNFLDLITEEDIKHFLCTIYYPPYSFNVKKYLQNYYAEVIISYDDHPIEYEVTEKHFVGINYTHDNLTKKWKTFLIKLSQDYIEEGNEDWKNYYKTHKKPDNLSL